MRQRLKPLYDKVRAVEKDLAVQRETLADIESRLADESIYADADRQDEIRQLVAKQAAAKDAIETLEWSWLEASEELERAS